MNTIIEVTLDDITVSLETAPQLFSPRRIDSGTLAMLELADLTSNDRVLDLGCGYGVVGIIAARKAGASRVVMTDVDPLAVKYARRNAIRNDVPEITIVQSDGFQDVSQTDFTRILSNPPYHTDFSVPRQFIRKGFNRLALGGRLLMVTRRRTWYQKQISSIFGGCRVHQKDGYFVFEAEKRTASYARRR